MSSKHSSPNWGGARKGAGHPRRYIHKKIPLRTHIQCSEPEQLTPQSDLMVYLAEMDEEGRRGIMVGDIWYGYDEALYLADFIEQHRRWLANSPTAETFDA